jgi:undecaprenyl-diphosphatase
MTSTGEEKQDEKAINEDATTATGGISRERASRRLWRAETIYIVALIAFGVLALFARLYKYFSWDLEAARYIQSLHGLHSLMSFVSLFGNGLFPWVMTLLTTILFFIRGRRSEGVGTILCAGGGELVNTLIKLFIARPRPTDDLVKVDHILKSQSFPSGHVTFYVCFFGFLFFVAYALLRRGSITRRLALVAAALPVLLIGLSRIYLGEHWPSDTLGAYLLGGLWLALSLHLYRKWKERATFHPEAQR